MLPSPSFDGQIGAGPSADNGGISADELELIGNDHGDYLVSVEDVQKSINRSRATVYRYTNTDPRVLNPPFDARKLNPEYRSDQKDPLLFHPNEVARFARDVLRIKQVTIEVLNSPSSATQHLLSLILEELQAIRRRLDALDNGPTDLGARRDQLDQSRPAA